LPPALRTLLRSFATHSRAAYTPETIRAAAGLPPTNSATVNRMTPELVFRSAGLTPDPWQTRYLADTHNRQLVLACRRAGKTSATAAKTLAHCLTTPDALALVFSPTHRQSREFCREVMKFARSLGAAAKPVRPNQTEVEWANGARLMSLPDSHEGVVGFTPSWVVIDEGSRVSDPLYKSVRPMLALGAKFTAISTPFGQRGWFFDIWDKPSRLNLFHHWRVTADGCPRISAEFLDEERAELGDRWFQQEWYCSFEDAVGAVFSKDVIDAAFDSDAKPLWEMMAV